MVVQSGACAVSIGDSAKVAVATCLCTPWPERAAMPTHVAPLLSSSVSRGQRQAQLIRLRNIAIGLSVYLPSLSARKLPDLTF